MSASGSEVDDSGLPRNRLWQPATAKWFAAVFGGTTILVMRFNLRAD